MRRRIVIGSRIAAGLAALALAAVLAVFAGDVLAASSTMKRDDLRFGVAPDARGLWKVEGRTPSLESILQLKDDLAWRVAAQRFQLSRARANIAYDPTRTLSRAETQAGLASAETQELTARQASPLRELLGDPRLRGGGRRPAERPRGSCERSSSEFRRAIRLDPSNDEAKFNLELLLRLLEPGGSSAATAWASVRVGTTPWAPRPLRRARVTNECDLPDTARRPGCAAGGVAARHAAADRATRERGASRPAAAGAARIAAARGDRARRPSRAARARSGAARRRHHEGPARAGRRRGLPRLRHLALDAGSLRP